MSRDQEALIDILDRNVITHDYDEVDLDEVWAVIQKNLPQLLIDIEPLISSEQS